MTIGKLPVGGTFTKKSPRSRLSARSVLLPSAEVSTGHPHPPKTLFAGCAALRSALCTSQNCTLAGGNLSAQSTPRALVSLRLRSRFAGGKLPAQSLRSRFAGAENMIC